MEAAHKHGLSLSEAEARPIQQRFNAAWPELSTWRTQQLRDTAEAATAAAWVAECLETGMRRYLTRVPVRVEVTVAQDWSGIPTDDASPE